ncbi:MAG: DUF3891 family protein [Acidimicrobiia bacterium]
MIVQPAEHSGDAAFVILQNDHTAFAGQLVRHFGNDRFAPLEPAELVTSLVEWHDEGWTDLDKRFLADPDTGLPYNLASTPMSELLPTAELTPTLGEARHPFIGLLSSMHSCGLFNGRYGLEDAALSDKLPPPARKRVDALLTAEGERQERLRAELLADSTTAHLVDDTLVLRTYKALEFFDIFSLYMQCEHPSRHQETVMRHVPVDVEPAHDVTITVTPLGHGSYRVSPYPFDIEPFMPATTGRYLSPQPSGTDLRALWSAADSAEQRVHLCA